MHYEIYKFQVFSDYGLSGINARVNSRDGRGIAMADPKLVFSGGGGGGQRPTQFHYIFKNIICYINYIIT